MNICANPECGKPFVSKTHNQKYCSSECCKIVTNARIMQKYYEKQDRKRGKVRGCAVCSRPLSRYNETRVCQGCTSEYNNRSRQQLLELIGA